MSIGLKGNADGSGAVQVGGSDAITITTGLAATFVNNVTVTGTLSANGVTGSVYPIVSGTAVASTSGTSIDFTSIPSWVKRITVMLSGVSTNGTSNLLVQIGAGSVTSSGYISASTVPGGATTSTAGFIVTSSNLAADTTYGNVIISLLGSNAWTESALTYGNSGNVRSCAGGVTLGGTLDRVRVTTVNGTDTFDAGSINILYE